MSKDPAILFYTGDFLNGCIDLTFEERGQYITLLCLQHQKGHLSEKTIRLSLGSVSVDVLSKFDRDEFGNYYNARMETEIQKRAQYIDSRRDNGLKGGRPKKAYAKPYGKAKKKHTEDENINEDNNIIEEYWNRWKKYKKDEFRFAYKSEDSENSAKKELISLSDNNAEIAVKIIEQSIANGWKGFFKLKSNGTNKKTGGVTNEQLAELLAEKYGSDSGR